MDSVSKKLIDFYENAVFCDITLIGAIHGFKLEAHRMVLSASSGYFDAMFRSNLREANAEEVTFPQWDGETLKTIVDYIYINSIELHNETVENVLKAADFFQISELIAACCCFMTEQLDPCNCLRLVFFAEQHNYEELYEKSVDFACTNFERVCTEQEFLELDVDQLIRFLKLDEICLFSERSVLRSVLAWIKHDEANRRPSVLDLLRHIRFPLLEARYIVENKESLCVDFESSTIVLDWLQYLLSPQSRARFPYAVIRPRQSCRKLIFLNVWEGNAKLKVQTYDPILSAWAFVDWPQPIKRRKFLAATVVDKQLIIGGGDTYERTEMNLECLDLQEMTWRPLPLMRQPRRLFALCELNGFLYAIVGIDKNSSGTVAKYDFISKKWTDVQPISEGFLHVQVVALDGLLYATCSEYQFLECYDPLTNKWTRLPSKNIKSTQFGFGAVGGCLYSCGGHFRGRVCTTVERYDPQIGEWTEVAPLSVGRSSMAVTGLGGRLIASGGEDGHSFLKTVEEYNPETNTWTTMRPLLADADNCSYLMAI